MKLKSNIFSQLYFQVRWKMLSWCKKINKPGCKFSRFSWTFKELSSFKVQLATCTEIEAIVGITLKSSFFFCFNVLRFKILSSIVVMFYVLLPQPLKLSLPQRSLWLGIVRCSGIIYILMFYVEFGKWHAIRPSVGGWCTCVDNVLAWVAWVARLRGWRASMRGVGGVLMWMAY